MTTRQAIVDVGRSWISTPFKHQASLKGIGADCIGFIAGVAAECGIPEALAWAKDKRFQGYGRTPNPSLLLDACDEYLDRILVKNADIADIYLMHFEDRNSPDPMHFALISALDPPYIIHAYAQARKVVENRLDDLWRSRIFAAYRFRGIT